MTDLSFDLPLIGPELRSDGRYWYTEQTGPVPPIEPAGELTDWHMGNAWISPSGNRVTRKRVKGIGKFISLQDGKVRDEFVMEDMDFERCGRLLELGGSSRIRKLIVNRVRALNVLPGTPIIRLLGMDGGGVEAHVTDFRAVYNEEPCTTKGDIPVGLHAGFKTKNAARRIDLFRIERAYIEGPKQNVDGFTNGDAFTSEPECALMELIDCEAVRCSDAGIDSKAAMTRITRYRSERTRYGIKAWGNVEGSAATIVQCWSAAVLLAPLAQYGECSFTFDGLVSEAADKPLFEIQNRAIRINATGRYEGQQLVRLSNGGRLAPGSTWNGEAI